jgi:hypothetical protein
MRNFDGVSVCVQALTWCAASASPDEPAARLLGAAEAVWRAIGGNLTQAVYRQFDRRSEEQVRSAIGERRFEAAFAEGSAYTRGPGGGPRVVPGLRRRGLVAHHRAASGGSRRADPSQVGDRQLLAEGLSNKDIAVRLVIAPRTAETHVEHILTKLGFTSRTQASAWVIEQQGH